MKKSEYRDFFAQCKEMLKMKYFLNKAGISRVNFSRFMKSPEFDWCLSIEKLDHLYNTVLSEISEKIA